jgi:hypothetical protein
VALPLLIVPIIVIAVPYGAVPAVKAMLVEVLAVTIVTVALLALVDPVKLLSPPYTAVMWCTPVTSVFVVRVAVPLLSTADPTVADPSMKMTVPVGVPLVALVIVLVSVMVDPYTAFAGVPPIDAVVPV